MARDYINRSHQRCREMGLDPAQPYSSLILRDGELEQRLEQNNTQFRYLSIGGAKMEITVKLFATLREDRGKVVILVLDDGTTAADVIDRLEISPEDVTMLLINGHDKNAETYLQDGDVLSLFPPVGGG